MNDEQKLLDGIPARYARGEKVSVLAKEIGMPWRRLWCILNADKPKAPRKTRSSRRQTRETSTGDKTPRNEAMLDADGVHRITFESIGEAVIDSQADYAQNETNRTKIAGKMTEHLGGHDSWANNFTRESLLDTIQNPPQHLLDAVDQMREQLVDEISPPVCTRRRVRRNQEWGDELEPEAVLVRSLTPWDRMSRETQPRRSVTIGVNLTVSSMQKPDELKWRGAAAAALADILNQRGVNVEIIAFWSVSRMSSRSSEVVSRYVVKRADMPLNLGTVSVALAEIAYARVVALYGLARHMKGVLSNTLGSCARLPQQDRRELDYLAESNVTSKEKAESWLRECVSRQESEVCNV